MARFTLPRDLYHGKGALEALKTFKGKKAIICVGGGSMKRFGFLQKAEDYLKEAGMEVKLFEGIEPDPSVETVMKGAAVMQEFEPDWIVAMGGGSPIDAAKAMWTFYEYPDTKFEDLITPFGFPELRQKARFAAIPSTSGTATEVTAFSVITNYQTGVKYPLADYELMPDMSIVDADNMMSQPKGLTSASGVDVLTHALEAYASVMATDYTDGLALKAMKNVFEYLPRAYENGNDVEARCKMADASCMAGMAFNNAFLGVCHSMAHKLGAFHHIPHGVANALLISMVVEYNAAECPRKMGTFSQYQYPHTMARYAECARFVGIQAKDDAEAVQKLIAKIEELKEKVGIKKTIADYGVDEKYFLETLDDMCEKAFDDQCTGANPRFPLISEIKDMFLRAYYGDNKKSEN